MLESKLLRGGLYRGVSIGLLRGMLGVQTMAHVIWRIRRRPAVACFGFGGGLKGLKTFFDAFEFWRPTVEGENLAPRYI